MIGQRIKQLRDQEGLTQKDLAKQLDIQPRTLGFYETGDRNPPIEILKKLAIFFDVSIDYLLGVTDVPNLYKEKATIEKQKREMSEYFTIDELEAFIRERRKNNL